MTTISHVPGYRASRAAAYTERSPRTRSVGLEAVGLVTLLVSAWGGIVPFLGPAIGFNGTGQPSWHWDLAQAVLGLAPGAVGVIVGLSLLAPSVTTVGWRRVGMSTMGLLGIAAGAWFVIGPFAWPVLTSDGYFVGASTPIGDLAHLVGYSLGPGLILAMAGAYMLGWATRHDSLLAAHGSSGDRAYGGAAGQMAGGAGPAWASNPQGSQPVPPPAPPDGGLGAPDAPAFRGGVPAPDPRPGGPPPRPGSPMAPPVREVQDDPSTAEWRVVPAPAAPPAGPATGEPPPGGPGYGSTGFSRTVDEAGYEAVPGTPPPGPAPNSPAA